MADFTGVKLSFAKLAKKHKVTKVTLYKRCKNIIQGYCHASGGKGFSKVLPHAVESKFTCFTFVEYNGNKQITVYFYSWRLFHYQHNKRFASLQD